MKGYFINKTIIQLVMLFTFISCSTFYIKKSAMNIVNDISTIKLLKIGKPNSVIPYKQWLSLKPEISEWKMKYGTFKDSIAEFNIGVFDKNKNGSFLDEYEDMLFVGNKNDSFFEYTPQISSTVTFLKENSLLDYNGQNIYKISKGNENDLVIENQ